MTPEETAVLAGRLIAIATLTTQLEALLTAEVSEYDYRETNGYLVDEHFESNIARNICRKLLRAAKADGACGCLLCQS